MSMQWKVLALVLRARAKIKVMLNEVHKRREKMKLFCCIFPSDYEFERDVLVQLWMAMGFSRQRDEEDYYNRFFDILLQERFILLSRVDILTSKSMYKVDHNIVKTLVDGVHTTEDKDLYTWLEDDNTVSNGSKYWHISLVSNVINQTTFGKLKSFKGLRTLLFIRNYGSSLEKIPYDMFLSFDLLQALDLSGSHIIELPGSIGNARQLRYLDLSFTLIESLPGSIDCLCQLQTLRLEGCKHLRKLPKGFTRLICLRHLDFDVLGQLSFLPRGIGALTELCALSAFIVDGSEDGCNIKELKTMNSLRGSCCISGLENASYIDFHEAALQDKKHITDLKLRWNDLNLFSTEDQHNAYNIVATLHLSSGLEQLQIVGYPGLEIPAWSNLRSQEKLVSITLWNCENKHLTLSLGILPNLKYLNIVHMNRILKIDSWFRGGYEPYAAFPKLEKLEIECMFSLETWTDVLQNDFQLLSKLIIKKCPKLIGLPFLSHLHSLKHLEISYCTMFKNLPDVTLSTSLECLTIDDCPFLKKTCSKDGSDWKSQTYGLIYKTFAPLMKMMMKIMPQQ